MRDAGRWRLVVTAALLLLALLIARWSWQLPFIGSAERALYDVRLSSLAPRVAQDERIVMIVYNDKTVLDTRKRSPLDRATLARALVVLDGMGARSIGIDILIDQPQDEDPALLRALSAMRTPTWLAYARVAPQSADSVDDQQHFLDAFMAGLHGTRVKPAAIDLVVDADGVARSWPSPVRGQPPLIANAMRGAAGAGYSGSLRYRLPRASDRPVFASLPIDLLADPAIAGALTDQIHGRDVLIGGDITDEDQVQTPMTARSGRTITGLEMHATMLAQLLDGALAPPLPGALLWGIALLAIAAGTMTALARLRWWQLLPFLAVQALFFGAAPFVLQAGGWDTQFLPALGWMLGWGLAFAAVGSAARAVVAVQRRFAQSALGKYLPRDVAAQILREPETLVLRGERRAIFVIFSDLEGSTELSHALAPERVASLMNRYLDMLSEVVLAHGGTIDKFVGDAVVAFWGAPIAGADDGRNAAKAAYALWQAGEVFRRSLPDDLPPIGRTRVGLHYGEAIVGNFGGEGRFQYTALGDSMNTASRLEGANKKLGTSVIASAAAAERSGLDWWRPLGRVVLRGRSTPIDIFEPAPDFTAADRRDLTLALALLREDRGGALQRLAAMAAGHPDDEALRCLLLRAEKSSSDEGFPLD
ncbi:MAG: adenylate/guanylate cyclase with Chase sensor [Sphingomonas bacterium]|nr:adenylate/guanylate cyclase with Chase sensor [Sphingomonas bacterium]